MLLIVGSAHLEGTLNVCCLSDKGFDNCRQVADEASKDVVSHPAHKDPQLLVVCGFWVGTGTQVQGIFHKAGDAFLGALGLNPEKILCPLLSELRGERPPQLGHTDVPRQKQRLVVLEPVPCSSLQRKVEVLQALLRSPSVVARHTLVVLTSTKISRTTIDEETNNSRKLNVHWGELMPKTK